MNRTRLTVTMVLGLAVAASAQAKLGDVTVSTDPAKAEAVERHAAELKGSHAHHSAHHTAHATKSTVKHHTQHAAMHHQTEPKASVKS